MNNTIKMLILSVIAGGVLMISAGANAEPQQQEDTNVVATQDAGLNLSDESSSDNWWGYGGYGLGWGGLGWGGWGGWGLGYSYWPYYGGFGFGGCCGFGGWGGWGGWGGCGGFGGGWWW